MFDLTVVSPQRVIFNDTVSKIWVDGDDSEYELLPFHSHVMGVVRSGRIIVDDKKAIPVRKGVVQFYENKCLILIEEVELDG